jgi:hypothetical protein
VPFKADGSVDAAAMGSWNDHEGVIGWTFEDEADRRSAIRPNPPITFARMQQITAQVRAATAKPIYLTFTGGGGGFDNADYKGDAAGQVSIGGPGHRPPGWFALPDVIVWDYHLWASGRPAAWYIHDRMQDRAVAWSMGKPQVIYAECSPQNVENKGRPGPTLEQFKEIISRRIERDKVNNQQSLAGFILFPQRVAGGFNFDATPDDIAAAMPGYFASIRPAPVVPAPPPLPETPPPPPIDLTPYVKRAEVQGMITDALQAQQLRFYDTVLKPLQDLTDVHTKQLLAIRKNLTEAATEGQ